MRATCRSVDNTVHTNLTVIGNSGGTIVTGNQVGKALTVTGNTGEVTDSPNTVGGKSKVQARRQLAGRALSIDRIPGGGRKVVARTADPRNGRVRLASGAELEHRADAVLGLHQLEGAVDVLEGHAM